MASFSFKQFTINQDRTAMKVGTDGVLLGAWCRMPQAECHILDIGTGTGLLALMTAQRNHLAHIDGIEIDAEAASEATNNCAASPFADRITIIHTPLQQYHPDIKYDMIVCNPPYFSNSLKSPDKNRETARHSTSLNFEELLRDSATLLRENGILAVVLPYSEKENFSKTAQLHHLKKRHETSVFSTTQSPEAKRVLMEFCLTQNNIIAHHDSITIEKARHLYTDEYISLTKDFYLKF